MSHNSEVEGTKRITVKAAAAELGVGVDTVRWRARRLGLSTRNLTLADVPALRTPSLVCPDCGREFRTPASLVLHSNGHYCVGRPTHRTCPDCGKLFASRNHLDSHLRATARLAKTPPGLAHMLAVLESISMPPAVAPSPDLDRCPVCSKTFMPEYLAAHIERNHPVTLNEEVR